MSTVKVLCKRRLCGTRRCQGCLGVEKGQATDIKAAGKIRQGTAVSFTQTEVVLMSQRVCCWRARSSPVLYGLSIKAWHGAREMAQWLKHLPPWERPECRSPNPHEYQVDIVTHF